MATITHQSSTFVAPDSLVERLAEARKNLAAVEAEWAAWMSGHHPLVKAWEEGGSKEDMASYLASLGEHKEVPEAQKTGRKRARAKR